jgi:(p)ppGpp synthase/HD superfamily hydrolase
MFQLSKIQKAIKFAVKTHEVYQKQKRKGKDVSYIVHPLTVGILLSRAGANDDVIAAGILHDTIEDSVPEKKVTFEMLEERFGKKVARMVLDVTETDKDLPWEQRKAQAIQHVEKFSHDSLLVKSADVISNTSEIIDDHARYGDQVFDRFSAPKEKNIENKRTLIAAILKRWPENPFASELKRLANVLKKEFMEKR